MWVRLLPIREFYLIDVSGRSRRAREPSGRAPAQLKLSMADTFSMPLG